MTYFTILFAKGCNRTSLLHYLPATKLFRLTLLPLMELREGNVFSRVCPLFCWGEGGVDPMLPLWCIEPHHIGTPAPPPSTQARPLHCLCRPATPAPACSNLFNLDVAVQGPKYIEHEQTKDKSQINKNLLTLQDLIQIQDQTAVSKNVTRENLESDTETYFLQGFWPKDTLVLVLSPNYKTYDLNRTDRHVWINYKVD